LDLFVFTKVLRIRKFFLLLSFIDHMLEHKLIPLKDAVLLNVNNTLNVNLLFYVIGLISNLDSWFIQRISLVDRPRL
jgi:hypothetical protein